MTLSLAQYALYTIPTRWQPEDGGQQEFRVNPDTRNSSERRGPIPTATQNIVSGMSTCQLPDTEYQPGICKSEARTLDNT